jgi:hypothetical protein
MRPLAEIKGTVEFVRFSDDVQFELTGLWRGVEAHRREVSGEFIA